MAACLSVILDVSGEIGFNQKTDVTAASSDHFYSLRFKNILRSLPNIPGQHDTDTHLAEHRSDSALASASLR